jgi:hypothetical protein
MAICLLLILCFASVALAGTNFIDGQVFIVTGGHESVKLALVAVAACRPDEFAGAVASTKSQIESERAKLNDIQPRADKSVEAASRMVDAVKKAVDEAITSPSSVSLSVFKTLNTIEPECIKLKG